MKCFNCQSEVRDNAKFCPKCGQDLRVKPSTATAQPTEQVCSGCGTKLPSGIRFCTACGKPVDSAVAQPTPQPEPTPQPKPTPQPAPSPQKPAPSPQDDSKKGKGVKTAMIAILILAAAGAAVFILGKQGKLPGLFPDKAESTATETISSEEAGESKETTEGTGAAEEAPAIDADAAFAEIDESVASAREMIKDDEELLEGIGLIQSAIEQYINVSAEIGDTSLAAERVSDVSDAYIDAVTRRRDILSNQELSGSIYAQIMSELDEAVSYEEKLVNAGFEVDYESLTSIRDKFDTEYREKMIDAFDDFCKGENWSRTEAWKLMQDTPGNMFEETDLDDPIRLRYTYALAWWMQKQIDEDLQSGVITGKGAALKIADIIEPTDYSLMLMNYYIQYMKNAGEDCSSVENAYKEILDHIEATQGLKIGKDVELAHFWYFNDFGEYSVDDVNGVTKENREWIRERMATVEF